MDVPGYKPGDSQQRASVSAGPPGVAGQVIGRYRARLAGMSARQRAGLLTLQLITAAGLAVDAYIHADLASAYDAVQGSISQGTLFRIEAGAASAAALIVLLMGGRIGFALAALVAASALGAILLYRYVDVGSLGPMPNMYEPVWFPEKTTAAIAEAVATAAAVSGLTWEILRRGLV